jgi:hydroxymethylpyrimidine kinase/phosphomethylpyrimidine kinase
MENEMPAMPVALTIAGSDSGGGAGIQADLKTFQALGCFGTSVLTAITAQNTTGVTAIQGIEPDVVAAQMRAVLDDFPVGSAKTGMLFSVEIIQAVRETWRALHETRSQRIPLVVDPVMVASTGARLLEAAAERALIEFLSEATLITPNLPEAEVILDGKIEGVSKMEEAVRELHKRTGAIVYLKGGHRLDPNGESVQDLYFDGTDMQTLEGPRLEARSTHGTGCTLSAAMAARLARGDTSLAASRAAREYLVGAMRNAPGLGAGIGPLNHAWNLRDGIG